MAKKKKISYEKAKEHFKKLPKKTQQRDMSRKSKKPYEKYNIPASYIKKGGHRKGDVKNLDTPQYTYGRRGTRLKSVYQLRRILKRKARDYKHPTTRNKRLKEYEKETKPMLDKLKDSDINGLFISYGDKKADGYGEKTTRVRKIKGFRGEEFRGLGFKFKKVKFSIVTSLVAAAFSPAMKKPRNPPEILERVLALPLMVRFLSTKPKVSELFKGRRIKALFKMSELKVIVFSEDSFVFASRIASSKTDILST